MNGVQRDLDVPAYESQEVSRKVEQVVKEPNTMLAFIVKGLEFKNREVCYSCTGLSET